MALAHTRPQEGMRTDPQLDRIELPGRQTATGPRESDEILRAIFHSSVGVAILATDTRFLEVNKALCTITGYAEGELLALDQLSLTHPKESPRIAEQIEQLLAGNLQTFVIEHRYVRKDGAISWVQNSMTLTRDTENRPASIIALCQDITERKQSEAQLAAELADTQLLQDLSAQLIEPGDEKALHEKIVDAVAAIMRSDFATMQMFYPKRGLKGELHLLASRGLTEEGKQLWEWVRFETDSTCGQALRTGKRAIAVDVATSDFLAGTAGGAALLAAGIHAAQSTPLVSRRGNFMGMISSHWRTVHVPTERDLRLLDILARQAADLIERQRAEDELRCANQDLEQFAYSASHDLQEPLRTIKIYSELLHASCGEILEGESAIYLGFLGNAATRMEMLVRDLLAYTQINSQLDSAENISTENALGHALANLATAIEESTARITSDPLPIVCINETHLRQLFQNLIGNAIKYRHPDRACTVRVSAERQGAFWLFTVRDNGIGIDPAYQARIFGLFTRLHGLDDPHTGTGLGLAICKRIVERYDGKIWVDSVLGEGSTFHFTLPA